MTAQKPAELEPHAYRPKCECESCLDQRRWFKALKGDPEAGLSQSYVRNEKGEKVPR